MEVETQNPVPIVRPPRRVREQQMRQGLRGKRDKAKRVGPRTDRGICRFHLMKGGCRNGDACEYKHTDSQCESCETYTEHPYCSRCYRKIREKREQERTERQKAWEERNEQRQAERAKRKEEYEKKLKRDGKPCIWCKKLALGTYCRDCAQEANQYILRQCAHCGSRMSATTGKYCWNCQ